MRGVVEEELDVGPGLRADLGLLAAGVLGRVEVVALAVVALHRGGQTGVRGGHGGADPVERDGGGDLGALLSGQHQHEAAAHAEADGAHGAAGHRVVGQQEVDGAAEVLRGLVDGQGHHHRAGLVGVVRGPAAVQVRRQGDEPGGGQAVGDVGDVVGQPPPLLDDQDAGAGAGGGHGQVAVRLTAGDREGRVLTGLLLGHAAPLGQGWLSVPHSVRGVRDWVRGGGPVRDRGQVPGRAQRWRRPST